VNTLSETSHKKEGKLAWKLKLINSVICTVGLHNISLVRLFTQVIIRLQVPQQVLEFFSYEQNIIISRILIHKV